MTLPRKEIYVNGMLYLTRYYLFYLLGKDYVLHKISVPDADQRLHTHPWRRAWSFVLKGSYREERLIGLDAKRGAIVGTRRVRWFNRITSTDAHRIATLYHKRYGEGMGWGISDCSVLKKRWNVWTLFVMGDYLQKWGFLENSTYAGFQCIVLRPYDEAPRGNTTVKHFGNCRLWKDGEAKHRDKPTLAEVLRW